MLKEKTRRIIFEKLSAELVIDYLTEKRFIHI